MKKALLICLAIIVGCSLLAGCSKRDTKYDVDVLDRARKQRIFIDRETGVQYIYIANRNMCGLSVRLNADGKPMIDGNVK